MSLTQTTTTPIISTSTPMVLSVPILIDNPSYPITVGIDIELSTTTINTTLIDDYEKPTIYITDPPDEFNTTITMVEDNNSGLIIIPNIDQESTIPLQSLESSEQNIIMNLENEQNVLTIDSEQSVLETDINIGINNNNNTIIIEPSDSYEEVTLPPQ